MPMILALNGAGDFDFGDFGKAVASAPVAALQRAMRDFGRSVGDSALIGLVVDGLTGPKTAAAANRMLRQHIGAGQAPESLRTGVLTPAQVAANAAQIAQLVNTEAHRRGFGIYVGPSTPDKARVTGKTAAVAGLQIALRDFGKSVGDGVLVAIVNDGKIGPKTTAAANRVLTRHIGANQAPANLRTGSLTQAQVLSEAARITQLINTEARRRGYGIYVGPPVTQTARREPAAKAPVVKYIPPSRPASREPSYVSTTTVDPGYTPTATPATVVVPATKTYVVPPSGGMDVEAVVKWSAIGLGVVALLGGAYFLISRRRRGGAAPVVAGFLGAGPTQRQMYYKAQRRSADADKTFLDLVRGPNGLTAPELEALIAKRPELWGRYRDWVRILPKRPGEGPVRFKGALAGSGYYHTTPTELAGFLGSPRQAKMARRYRVHRGKRDEFDVTVWNERDRLHIGVTKNGYPINVDWWDDDARSMIEDGFFNPRRLKESVLDYAEKSALIQFTGARFGRGFAGSGYYHTTPSEFTPGQRVQLHPGMSLWMQGARYGTVKKIGRDRVHVELDATGKTVTIPPRRLQIED